MSFHRRSVFLSLLCFASMGIQSISKATIGDNFLIPTPHPKDNAFDIGRGVLYISNWNSTSVARYDVRNRAWLTPMQMNQPSYGVNGIDITPDGRWLYAASPLPDPTNFTGYIGKFDLQTGVDQGFTYGDGGAYDGGAYDLKMTNNGKAFFTSSNVGFLRQIDLATDNVSTRPDAPGSWPGGWLRDRAGLFPSGDRNTMFVWEGNISSGPGFVYNAINDSFGPPRNLNTSWTAGASVNRNGTLISTPVSQLPFPPLVIRDGSLNVVRQLASYPGAKFDSIRDRLYVLNESTARIEAFDTNTWGSLFSFPVGEPINDCRFFQEGFMTTSSDGQYLMLNTDSGIRVYTIPEPHTAIFISVGVLLLLRRRSGRRVIDRSQRSNLYSV